MHKMIRILFTLILAIGITAPIAVPAVSCPGSGKSSCGKSIKAAAPKKVCPKNAKKICTGTCPAKCK